jgi:hypothetical protein
VGNVAPIVLPRCRYFVRHRHIAFDPAATYPLSGKCLVASSKRSAPLRTSSVVAIVRNVALCRVGKACVWLPMWTWSALAATRLGREKRFAFSRAPSSEEGALAPPEPPLDPRTPHGCASCEACPVAGQACGRQVRSSPGPRSQGVSPPRHLTTRRHAAFAAIRRGVLQPSRWEAAVAERRAAPGPLHQGFRAPIPRAPVRRVHPASARCAGSV